MLQRYGSWEKAYQFWIANNWWWDRVQVGYNIEDPTPLAQNLARLGSFLLSKNPLPRDTKRKEILMQGIYTILTKSTWQWYCLGLLLKHNLNERITYGWQ
jgi:hypothetical protein